MNIIDFLFPPQCVNCGKWGTWLCPTCYKNLKRSLPECYVCRRLSPNFNTHLKCLSSINPIKSVLVLYRYNEITKQLLWKYKGDGSYRLASFIIDSLVTPFFAQIQELLADACLTIIPSHKNRGSSRGFSQTKLLVKLLIKKINFKKEFFYSDLLISTWEGHQAKLTRSARLNKKKRFILNKKVNLPCKHIVIFDDVMSTGQTLNSASILLLKHYNVDIRGIVLFRGRPYWENKK